MSQSVGFVYARFDANGKYNSIHSSCTSFCPFQVSDRIYFNFDCISIRATSHVCHLIETFSFLQGNRLCRANLFIVLIFWKSPNHIELISNKLYVVELRNGKKAHSHTRTYILN